MDLFNRLVTPETVIWVAAGVALVLLVCLGPVSEIWISARRDSAMRTLKVAVYLVVALTVIFPALLLLTGQTVKGTGCGWYLLFFLLFWYYLGRRIGMARGRKDVTDLIGIESSDSIMDAQDRLYESRLRFPRRDNVVESIKQLSRERNADADASGGEDGAGNGGKIPIDLVLGTAVEVPEQDPADNITMRQ